MNKQEAKKFVVAQGVPPLLLKEPEGILAEKAAQYLAQFSDMLTYRGSVFIATENIVNGSRVGVWFLLTAFEHNVLNAGYLTVDKLSQIFADSWEESEAYAEFLHSPFVVLDRIIVSQLDAFKKKTLVKFMEERLVNLRPSVFVADSRPGFLPKSTQNFMAAAGCKLLSDIM